jgi:hypothetical protein
MIVVEAPFHQNHGRPRDVLRYIEEFLSWQDHAILTLAVEVDGDWYVPAWVFEG